MLQKIFWNSMIHLISEPEKRELRLYFVWASLGSVTDANILLLLLLENGWSYSIFCWIICSFKPRLKILGYLYMQLIIWSSLEFCSFSLLWLNSLGFRLAVGCGELTPGRISSEQAHRAALPHCRCLAFAALASVWAKNRDERLLMGLRASMPVCGWNKFTFIIHCMQR